MGALADIGCYSLDMVLNALGYVMSWFLLVCFGLVGLMGLSGLMALNFNVTNVVALVLGGGVAFLLFRYKDNFRIEYEYSFTNGEMDFAMVLGNARRKQLLPHIERPPTYKDSSQCLH